MLEEILRHLNNWFLVPDGVHDGTFTVEDGGITLPFLADGQYFRICGSVFNDGLHIYPADDLEDETFDGTIWALAIPRTVVELADEIAEWQEKNPVGPYTSESFGGYSYSRATGSTGQPAGWQDIFRVRLNPYRKVRENGPVRGQRPIRAYYRPWNPDYPFGGDY